MTLERTRVGGAHSLHETTKPELCPDGKHGGVWRTVYCDNVRDVIECSQCGHQRNVPCNFDEDFS